ncbi:MAG: BCCT family transporter [Alphaproteobacteria bacterium]
MADLQSGGGPRPTNQLSDHGPDWLRVNGPVFFISAGLIFAFCVYGVWFSETAESQFQTLLAAVSSTFGWFYVTSVAFFLVFAVAIALSPFGRIKLGRDDSEPDYSYTSWFAMLFSAGMGIGLLFFGVAEPITHYANPPTGEGSTFEAARTSMVTTFFHWGIHAWAVYIIVGMSLAYFAFRFDLPLTISSALYPLLGERIHGPIGHAVDIVAVLGTLFGVATSLGLGVAQVNAGLGHLFDLPVTTGVQIALIAAITSAATVSVVLGLDGGIKRLSELNLLFAVLLLVFVLVAGPTIFLLNTLAQNLGAYLSSVVSQSFRLYAYEPNEWIGSWTLFYWGWWISWSPFVGMFIARISHGRTIREFVLGVMFVPTGFTFLWLTIFGSTALYAELNDLADLTGIVRDNLPVAVFVMLETLPLAAISSLLAITLVVTFFITSSDSGSLVIDMITSGGDPDPPVWQRVFWAVTEGVVAAVLLLAGGLVALQAATITMALPFCAVLLVICAGLYKALSNDAAGRTLFQSRPVPPTIQGAVIPWQRRLSTIIRHYRRAEVAKFLAETVVPTLEKVAEQIRSSGLEASVTDHGDMAELHVGHQAEADFRYAVRMRGFRPLSFAFPEMPSGHDRNNGRTPRHYRAEVHVNGLNMDYDVMGYTGEQVISDVLTHYDAHIRALHLEASVAAPS